MSDRGGRGPRGGRGGRGDDRGRGGNRGSSGPSRGDGSDRGRGGYRGSSDRGRGDGSDRGRGGYRGGSDRGRGDGSDRGRGGYRGGFGSNRGDGFDRGRGRGGRRPGSGFGRGGGRGSSDRSAVYSAEGQDSTPDAAVTELENRTVQQQASSSKALASRLETLAIDTKSASIGQKLDYFPERPAFGTQGENIVVWANYFQVNTKPITLYRYQISATQPPSKEVKGRKLHIAIQKVLDELQAGHQKPIVVTEFKNHLFTLKPLLMAQQKLQIQLPLATDSTKFDAIEVALDGPTELALDDMLGYIKTMRDDTHEQAFPRFPEVIDALNCILGHRPRSRLGEIAAIGNGRYFPFDETKKIQELLCSYRPLIAARGYFQSARIATGRLLLNVNAVHSVFKISGPLTQIFDSLRVKAAPKGDRAVRTLRTINKFLSKTRAKVQLTLGTGQVVTPVKTIHSIVVASGMSRGKNEKPPKVQPGWEFPGPKNLQFWMVGRGEEQSRYISIFDYYQQKHGKVLADYPLVNTGTPDKPVFFPAELVEIQPGQRASAKLTGDETTVMLNFACRTPFANAESITTDGRQTLALDGNETLQEFGITIDKKLLAVCARILAAPAVSYFSGDGKQRKVDQIPQNGAWNMRSVRVVQAGKAIKRWSWVNVLIRGNERPADGSIVTQFSTFMNKSMGIDIDPPKVPHREEIEGDLAMNGGLEKVFEWAKKEELQFFLFILSDRDSTGIYSKIKLLGDCFYGIQTSCVVGRKFEKAQPGFFANVGLKWNLKAGGINHRLKDETGLMKEGRLMIAGYDVTHPTNMGNRNTDAPSLAGLVASVDRYFGQWPSVTWEQASRQEMLDDTLVDAFASRIELWKRNNKGQHPTSIVIFRDGVSEGQYAQVLDTELPMIREACRKSCPAKDLPKITIVVSVKRHQTRFYPTNPKDMSNSGNVKNGTVVDRGITQVRYWDFFLTAHEALQGTARPAHYSVLLDEIFRDKFKQNAANELEKLTHELCYLFGRATKAVSICPPAYYADIVCERARAHRPEWFEDSDMETMSTVSGQTGKSETRGRQVHEAVRDTMYYI